MNKIPSIIFPRTSDTPPIPVNLDLIETVDFNFFDTSQGRITPHQIVFYMMSGKKIAWRYEKKQDRDDEAGNIMSILHMINIVFTGSVKSNYKKFLELTFEPETEEPETEEPETEEPETEEPETEEPETEEPENKKSGLSGIFRKKNK